MCSRPITFYRAGSYKPDDSAVYLMRRITLATAAAVDRRLESTGLTHAQWVPLLKLHQGAASTPAELARVCHLDAGAMTRTLDRLEAKGLVRRERSDQDRRAVNLALTALGQETAREIPPILSEVQNAQLRGFSREEFETLKGLLQRVLDNTLVAPVESAARRGKDDS